ncbi:MAG: putative metal-binding motif-containing protein, partial [Proteobacteria bacterium]|nr:putative metal-binding motif-containing protein [Pseudomonadota bacterium]
ECLFNLSPSKTTKIEYEGEIVEISSDRPIPVSAIDSRINAENYNKTHSSQAAPNDDIGICAYSCTKEEDRNCPAGWSCQVILKGLLDYPDIADLPQPIPESERNKTGFVSVCRRDMTETLQKDISYGLELCKANEDKCAKANMVFYNGMCLEPCEAGSELCPYFFSCKSVETDKGTVNACVPNAGTCGECYDNDGDGAGYGHCDIKGIDCDDNNPNAYYEKPLTCDDLEDENGDEIPTDLNCNGVIDKFELAGTNDNCMSCGHGCAKPNSANITVSCDPQGADYDVGWRQKAKFEDEIPEFACIEKCAFGMGDCGGDAYCTTELLQGPFRKENKDVDDVLIPVNEVIISDDNGKIYALDEDGDGFPMIDVANSQKAAVDKRQLLLDSQNSVICCANNEKYCYTANHDWTSIPLSATSYRDEDGNLIKYASPAKSVSPASYDINDKNPEINPAAIEKCDGIDNDGSTILSGALAPSCSVWCATHDCESTISTTSNGVTTYAVNAFCDATEDGSFDPEGYNDLVDNHKYPLDADCQKRSATGHVCNVGKVTCAADKAIACRAGTPNCSCGVGEGGHAYRITYDEDGNQNEPTAADYVKSVSSSGGVTQTTRCRCDGSLCKTGTCTDEDSEACFGECSKNCTLTTEYALTCTVDDNICYDNDHNVIPCLDGLDADGKPKFDGIDDDCDGRIDEDGMIPCIITAENAPYDSIKNGVKNGKDEIMYETYYTRAGYSLFTNADSSINLCRIGILQSKKTIVGDEVTYEPICVPLYVPRDYDFYGDAVDSNCDGVDYDINHTVFLGVPNQGDIYGSNTKDNNCRFNTTLNYIKPCATIDFAIGKAASNQTNPVRDANNFVTNPTFYDDIIVLGASHEVATAYPEDGINVNTLPSSYAIQVPMLQQQETKQILYYYPGDDLPDEEIKVSDNKSIPIVKDGHILDAYKLHSLLVEGTRTKSSFDANKYLFSYEEQTSLKHVNEFGEYSTEETYKRVKKYSEQEQPEETLRIYGGFSRNRNSNAVILADKDRWSVSTTSTNAASSFTWKAKPKSVKMPITFLNHTYWYTDYIRNYAFIQPTGNQRLSLKMDRININVQGDGALPKSLVDGATYVAINAMNGVNILNLSNVNITVTAPAGYDYTADDTPSANTYDGTDGDDGEIKSQSGKDDDYINKRKNNTCHTHDQECGYGIDGTIIQNYGGCGGFAWTRSNTGYENGRPGGISSSNGSTNDSDNGGTCSNMSFNGGDHDWHCPKIYETKNGVDYSKSQGKNGRGGAPGANGNNAYTTLGFSIQKNVYPYYLYVESDRRKAKGSYGFPGEGGGGGAVFQCWTGTGDTNTDAHRCYGGRGGMGGCG